jgi:hypothetical protein
MHAPELSVPMPGWLSGVFVSADAVFRPIHAFGFGEAQRRRCGRRARTVTKRSSCWSDLGEPTCGHHHRRSANLPIGSPTGSTYRSAN